jgi:hypothetical protein
MADQLPSFPNQPTTLPKTTTPSLSLKSPAASLSPSPHRVQTPQYADITILPLISNCFSTFLVASPHIPQVL